MYIGRYIGRLVFVLFSSELTVSTAPEDWTTRACRHVSMYDGDGCGTVYLVRSIHIDVPMYI